MSDPNVYPPPGQPAAPPPPGSPQQHPGQQAWFPPPAYPSPAYAAPGYPGQGYPLPMPGYPQMPMAPPAHKPGAIPLRPLGLGDIYDGAFKVIRSNPGATVGSAVLVSAVAMAIPILVTGFLTTLFDLSLGSFDTTGTQSENAADLWAALGGAILQAIGLIFVTGMVSHVAAAAAIGQRLSLGQAWAATRGKRGKLVGLSALLAFGTAIYLAAAVAIVVIAALTLPQTAAIIFGILGGIAGLCGLIYLWGRVYYLAVPPLMLEPIGVIDALGRSWRLTSRQFWRTFGIGLLTIMVTQTIGGILGIPFTIIGTIAAISAGDGELGLMLYLIATGLATVVSAAFVAPFTSSVTTLQYVDLRMRKEGYDVELLTRAGINPS